jgi:hypothetical protein
MQRNAVSGLPNNFPKLFAGTAPHSGVTPAFYEVIRRDSTGWKILRILILVKLIQ